MNTCRFFNGVNMTFRQILDEIQTVVSSSFLYNPEISYVIRLNPTEQNIKLLNHIRVKSYLTWKVKKLLLIFFLLNKYFVWHNFLGTKNIS